MKHAAWSAFALTLFQACAAPDCAEWPESMPPRDFFARAWQGDPGNAKRQALDAYLGWVRRFYDGTSLASGWTAASQELTEGLSDEPRALLAARLAELGRELSAEWAKDNRCRRVTSGMLPLWAHVMKRAHAERRAVTTVDRILQDLRGLLAGELRREAIRAERYADLVAAAP